jgi:nucleotide-binding universal stress UspA family protein
MLIGATAVDDERTGIFSTMVDRILALVDIPTVVLHLPADDSADASLPTNILVPVVANRSCRAAEELAYSIARTTEGQVSALHVVNRPQEQGLMFSSLTEREAIQTGREITAGTAAFGERLGISVETLVQVATNAEEEIVGLANESGFDLLVIGASNRPLTNRPFFGHRVSYILQHANIPVAIVALHSRLDRGSQG